MFMINAHVEKKIKKNDQIIVVVMWRIMVSPISPDPKPHPPPHSIKRKMQPLGKRVSTATVTQEGDALSSPGPPARQDYRNEDQVNVSTLVRGSGRVSGRGSGRGTEGARPERDTGRGGRDGRIEGRGEAEVGRAVKN